MTNLRPVAIWAGGMAAASLLAIQWLGPGGLVLAAVAGVLALIWKFDNWSGSCFMLAILLLIVVAILLLLVLLMAMPRR
jgi:peptidoglycan/LPS O-acetylase OafA/YrhL